jgi:tRNA (cmo5U34)-methyltransferase
MASSSVSSIGHAPSAKWKFDESVTECFEDMLEKSIPQYEVMRAQVFNLGKRFLGPKGVLLDLGCSKGGAIKSFAENYPEAKILGFDVSKPMLVSAKALFADFPNVEIQELDLRYDFPSQNNASLVISNLTLQFLPIEYRQKIVQNAFDSLTKGGAFILVEKILGDTPSTNEIFVDAYHDSKKSHGYSEEDVNRKRFSLEGVLVPVTNSWNIDLLKQAGFRSVDCFWRFLNFSGYLAIK